MLKGPPHHFRQACHHLIVITNQDSRCRSCVDLQVAVFMQLTDKFLNQAPEVINEGVHTDFNGGDHGGIAPVFNVRKVRQHRGS